MNRGKTLSNTSGFKGVSFDKQAKRFRASITLNYKTIFIGLFDYPEKASEAYKAAALNFHGEFANIGCV